MAKQKAKPGIGTWSWVCAIAAIIGWSSYVNGVAPINILANEIGYSNTTVITLCVLVLTVPGIIFGIVRNRDWGAKFGIVVCSSVTAVTLFPLVRTLLQI